MKKILMVGQESYETLSALSRLLRESCQEYVVDVFRVNTLQIVNLDDSLESRNNFKSGDVNFRCKRSTGNVIARTVKLINRIFIVSLKLQRYSRDYDIIHLQGIFHNPILYAILLIRHRKIVASCWGSDVLRSASIFQMALQKKVLNKCKAITVTGIEFKEIVLAKYGRNLEKKIYETFFNPDIGALPIQNRECGKRTFKKLHNQINKELIVCVGHNGDENNNHITIIRSLGELSYTKKCKFSVVVPMTYGGTKEYINAVEVELQKAGLDGIVLKKYMSSYELNCLRLATDIFAYAPISDAFSASVSQALASGSCVVVGSWLPYKRRLRAGFYYHEIDSPAQIGEKVDELIDKIQSELFRAKRNRGLSEIFFHPHTLAQQWSCAYQASISQ